MKLGPIVRFEPVTLLTSIQEPKEVSARHLSIYFKARFTYLYFNFIASLKSLVFIHIQFLFKDIWYMSLLLRPEIIIG